MAYASVGDLIKAFREEQGDETAPYLWTDAHLTRLANEALVAFAEQTRSIYDDSGVAAVASYAAGQQDFELHPAVIDVVEAYAGGHRLRLAAPGVIRRSELPSGSVPQLLVLGSSVDTAKLYPAPALAGTLELTVIRRPLAELARADTIPDIPQADRPALLLYMAHRAYHKHDADVFDPAKARAFGDEFERACQAIYEKSLLRRSSAAQTIRFRW